MGVILQKERTLSNILAEAFWDEVGHTIRPEELAEKVYHYTSLEGLIGILSNKKIWMTNSNFLNDMSELTYFQTLTEDTKVMLRKKISINSSENLANSNLLDIFIDAYDEAVDKRFNKPDESFEIYVISLSENNDSLTLWGNYAKGKGYSVCFNMQTLLSGVNNIKLGYMVYNKVIYNRDMQLEILTDALVRTFEILLKEDFPMETLKEELLSYFNSLIISYSIFFKDNSFEPEEEFRIALTTSKNLGVKFRTNEESIIPYIEMNFEASDISGVVIGPKNNSDIAEKGVKTFLKKSGYDSNELLVRKSTIPLRF